MRRYFSFFLSFLFLVGGVAVYAGMLLGISHAISAASAARASATATTREELFSRRVQGFLQETETSREGLEAYLAKDASVVSLIEEIDAAGKRDHVSVVIASVGVTNAPWKFHEPLEVILTAQGTFADMAGFATDLESIPEASHLSSMTLESTDKKGWFGTFLVDFVKEKVAVPIPKKT